MGSSVMHSRILSCAALCSLLLAQVHEASAATWYVKTNGSDAAAGTAWTNAKQTIQAAIDVAFSNDVVLVSNGVYSVGGRTVNGWAVTNRVAITNAITVASVNGPSVTRILGRADPLATNGNAAVRCVYAGTNSFLTGFTLAGGHTRTNGDWRADQSGGGVWCEVSAVISNCTLLTNGAAVYGGGSYQGTLNFCALTSNSMALGGTGGGSCSGVLDHCTLSGNTALTGGGSFNSTLSNCTLAGNAASMYGGGAGQGSLTGCTLSNNSAQWSGGAAYYAPLQDCTLVGNVAGAMGGATFLCPMTNCTISGNAAGHGGGVSGGTLVNCTISGNTALTNGGGAWGAVLLNCALSDNSAVIGGGSANGTLFNCTLSGNSAQFAGGSSSDTLYNCIVYFNTATVDANWSGNTSIQFCCTTPLPGFGLGNFTNLPRLAGIYNPHPVQSSPCIDAASAQYVATATDLDGNPRTNGPAVDVGAIEFTESAYTGALSAAIGVVPSSNVVAGFSLGFVAAISGRPDQFTWDFGDSASATDATITAHAYSSTGTYLVVLRATNLTSDIAATASVRVITLAAATRYVATNGNDASAGTNWTTAKKTIPAAITNVPAAGGWVWVSNGAYAAGTVLWQGLTNRVVLTNCITVQSMNGPTSTAIRGAADPAKTNGNAAIRCAWVGDGSTLSGFSLNGGYTSSNANMTGCGGGVYCESAAAVITNCLIVSNAAGWHGGGAWGGTLNDCVLSSNRALLNGGGAAFGTLNHCTLSHNVAVNYGGGAYYAALNDCSIQTNRATGHGGGTYAGTLDHCTLSNNLSSAWGGGSCQGTLNDCVLWGNSGNWGGGAGSSVLSNCTLTANRAVNGGGSAMGTLVDCLLSANITSQNGGGSYRDALVRCTLTGNVASNDGGGAYIATLHGCVLWGNTARFNGGGTHSSSQDNCLVIGNVANNGGGAYQGTFNNCTLSSNTASLYGGVYAGALMNSIIYFNSASTYSNYYASAMTNCCAAPPLGGPGNIASSPQFVAIAATNFRLAATSPCIDTGSNALAQGETDLDGNPRIVNEIVDMGAYEYRGSGSPNLIWYVATNGSDAAVGTNWATAKQTLHGAIDRTIAGDTVLVGNGIYATGGRTVDGWSITNRVAITNAITVQSEYGPAVTTIRGAWDPVTTNGEGAVRCAYVGVNATLSGFTLTHGATRGTGADYVNEVSGGGAWCASGARLSHCVLAGNSASNYGGGSYQGVLIRCTLSDNSASYGGGSAFSSSSNCVYSGNVALGGAGSYVGSLDNCVLSGNFAAEYAGGSDGDTLNNCTLVGNAASSIGGGCHGSIARNCIVYSNSALMDPNYSGGSMGFSCTTPDPGGTGNITNEPEFVDAATSNFHLKATSPCNNRGSNAFASNSVTDLDGNPRIAWCVVDMGAYEHPCPVGYRIWADCVTNGLTNVDDCATGDGYPNLLKYATGSNATNSDDLAHLTGARSNSLFCAKFNRNTNASDVTLIVESASAINNDAPWTGIATNINGSWGGATNVAEAGTTNPLVVTVQDTQPATNRFLRLRVGL